MSSIAEFEEFYTAHQSDPVFIAIFKGTKDPETGEDWCDDCAAADPFIQAGIQKSIHPAIAYCSVGLRDEWKNRPDNPFRTNNKTRLRSVPTLIRFQSGSEIVRLEERQLTHQAIIDEIFTN